MGRPDDQLERRVQGVGDRKTERHPERCLVR
jgi:hypothetical protein